MDNKDLEILIEELRALPKESEWVEFKVNKATLIDSAVTGKIKVT